MGKAGKNWILPGAAVAALVFVATKSACQDSRYASAVRFKNALIHKDLNELYEFVEPEEREALQLSRKSFDSLMTEEFFTEWDFSHGQWNFQITTNQNGNHLICESLSDPKSNSSLGVQIVGEPGHFRCPAFIHFALQATAMRRFGVDRNLPGGLGRMSPLLKLLDSDIGKLRDMGIVADYDPGSHGIDPLAEMRSRFALRIDKWRAEHP